MGTFVGGENVPQSRLSRVLDGPFTSATFLAFDRTRFGVHSLKTPDTRPVRLTALTPTPPLAHSTGRRRSHLRGADSDCAEAATCIAKSPTVRNFVGVGPKFVGVARHLTEPVQQACPKHPAAFAAMK